MAGAGRRRNERGRCPPNGVMLVALLAVTEPARRRGSAKADRFRSPGGDVVSVKTRPKRSGEVRRPATIHFIDRGGFDARTTARASRPGFEGQDLLTFCHDKGARHMGLGLTQRETKHFRSNGQRRRAGSNPPARRSVSMLPTSEKTATQRNQRVLKERRRCGPVLQHRLSMRRG